MNGIWQKITLAIVGLIIGTLASSGYMSCQYTALSQELDDHKNAQQVERVDLEHRLSTIETLLREIKEDIRK